MQAVPAGILLLPLPVVVHFLVVLCALVVLPLVVALALVVGFLVALGVVLTSLPPKQDLAHKPQAASFALNLPVLPFMG